MKAQFWAKIGLTSSAIGAGFGLCAAGFGWAYGRPYGVVLAVGVVNVFLTVLNWRKL